MKNLLNKRVIFLILLNLIGILLLIAGIKYKEAKSSNNTLPPDTSTSGKITIYTSFPEEQGNEYIKAFKTAYPNIQIELVYLHPFEIVRQLRSNRQNTTADVVWGMPSTFVLLLEWDNLLKGYAPPGLSAIKPNFRDTNTNPQWIGLSGHIVAFCINPTKLAELNLAPPTSWQDLAKTDYKGLLVFPHPETSETDYLAISNLLGVNGNVLGWDYLDKLHQNVGEYTSNENKTCELVSAGKYAIGVNFVDEMNVDPTTIKVVFPTDHIMWQTEVVAIINKDVIKHAAKTFIEWSISEPAMSLYAKNHPIRAIENKETNTTLVESYPQEILDGLKSEDFSWIAANYNRLIDEWYTRYKKE